MKHKSLFLFTFLFCVCITGTLQLQAQLPVINSFSPATGYIGSLITIKGSNLNNSTSVTIGGANAIIISAENTLLVAMVMPNSITGAVSVTTASGNATASNKFTINASKPPIKQLGDKLYDNHNQIALNRAEEGYSVAISADGNTAVAGGDYDSSGIGAVWVYTRINNIWVQQGKKLIGNGASGLTITAQGSSIAISADGNTLIEGGDGDNGFTGAAWIFTRDKNGVWSQQGNKLVGSNFITVGTASPEQGYAVSISADGNTAIIGGRRDSNYVGAAWIFTRSNNVWTDQQKLIGTGYIININDQGFIVRGSVQMGSSVALSADGNTALIGGPDDNDGIGAVWVFTRSGNTWIQQGEKLLGTGGNRSVYGGIQQGTSVAASADGNTIIIGAPFDLDTASTGEATYDNNGALWIFTRSGNTWTQQGNKLFASDAFNAEEGWSVSISADGNTTIAGGPTDNGYFGGAWVYTRNNGIWKQSSNKLLGTGYVGASSQGWSVGISEDGNTAIVGGPEDYYQEQGAVWVYADTSNSVLAVSSLNFKAYLFGTGVQTLWTDLNELNLTSYDVERSNNGYNFIKIADIPAKTNTALQNNYSWFDALPFTGNNFYRIKAINKDGSIQYSSTVKVNIANNQSSIQVYPNPVDDKKIHLRLNNIIEGNYIISVYNTSGKTLYRQSFQHFGGSESIAINLKNAAAGMYHVELKNNTNNYHTTVMLQ